MDPRHPKLALAANTCALITGIGVIFSSLLSIGTPKGWGNIETVGAVLVPIFLVISWWGKREHTIPIVHNHGGANVQYEAMEELPTMVSLDNVQENVNPNTAAVIASIVGTEVSLENSAVSSAITTLSTGEIGKSAAAAVAHNDVDHTKVNSETFDSRGFQTQGVDAVPLPVVPALELPDLPEAKLPEMSDLDDLLSEDANAAAPPPLDLPDLPDF